VKSLFDPGVRFERPPEGNPATLGIGGPTRSPFKSPSAGPPAAQNTFPATDSAVGAPSRRKRRCSPPARPARAARRELHRKQRACRGRFPALPIRARPGLSKPRSGSKRGRSGLASRRTQRRLRRPYCRSRGRQRIYRRTASLAGGESRSVLADRLIPRPPGNEGPAPPRLAPSPGAPTRIHTPIAPKQINSDAIVARFAIRRFNRRVFIGARLVVLHDQFYG